MTKSRQSSLPNRADGLAVVALLFAMLCVLAAFGTVGLVRDALTALGQPADRLEH